ALAALLSCAKAPEGRSAIDNVTVRGAVNVDESDVLDKMATRDSPKFLGVARGLVFDYEILDPATLQRDVARVERFYHARGYYGAMVRASRVFVGKDNHVDVEIVVEEGEPTVNRELRVDGV